MAGFITCSTCDKQLFKRQVPARISSKCLHRGQTCTPCLREWIESCIASKGWVNVACPECEEDMEYPDIKRHSTKKTFARYDQLSCIAALSTDASFQWCRGPDCQSGQVHADSDEGPIMTCFHCGFKTCVACQVPFHDGEACSQYNARLNRLREELLAQDGEAQGGAATGQKRKRGDGAELGDGERGTKRRLEDEEAARRMQEKFMEEMASKKLLKRYIHCPGKACGYKVAKISGCDHMKCTKCKTEFCYRCGADYVRIFDEGNGAHAKDCKHYREHQKGYTPPEY